MNRRTVSEALIYGKKFLKEAGIESFSIDAEVLLMHAVRFDKVQLFTKNNYILSVEEDLSFELFLKERAKFKPVQYIVGKCEFMSLDFIVNESTLIPRGDTEILVEALIEYIKKYDFKTILDIGTGSGAVAVSTAAYCPQVSVTAVDVSEDALKTAKDNAKLNNVSERVSFFKSDVFKDVSGKFDAIVSNPPYIKSDLIPNLLPQVKDFEPLIALDGGTDGLYFYKKIISGSCRYLSNTGMLFFEIGFDQGEEVSGIMRYYGFADIKILKDLAGLDRVVLGKKTEEENYVRQIRGY